MNRDFTGRTKGKTFQEEETTSERDEGRKEHGTFREVKSWEEMKDGGPGSQREVRRPRDLQDRPRSGDVFLNPLMSHRRSSDEEGFGWISTAEGAPRKQHGGATGARNSTRRYFLGLFCNTAATK